MCNRGFDFCSSDHMYRLPKQQFTENETVGAARRRKRKRTERRDQTDDNPTDVDDGAVERAGSTACRARDRNRLRWRPSRGDLDGAAAGACTGAGAGAGASAAAAAAAAAATATANSLPSRGSVCVRRAAKRSTSRDAGRRGKSSAAGSAAATTTGNSSGRQSKQRGKDARKKTCSKKVPGIFGIPVTWATEDCDYDDSDDATYVPTTCWSDGQDRASSARYCRSNLSVTGRLVLRPLSLLDSFLHFQSQRTCCGANYFTKCCCLWMYPAISAFLSFGMLSMVSIRGWCCDEPI